MLPRVGDGFRHLSYDLPFLFLPAANISNENAIILRMDERSTKQLKQNPMQPWDRGVHTNLLKVLTDQRPEAVVFDVLFDTSSKDTNVDLALAQAMTAN